MLETNVWVEELKECSGKQARKAVKDDMVIRCQIALWQELLITW